MIDATIVRARACAAGYVKGENEECALGRSSGGFTTKIHAKVDALGNPIKFILTKGRQHEMTQAEALLQGSHPQAVLADKAYNSQEFHNAISCFSLMGFTRFAVKSLQMQGFIVLFP